MRKTKVTAVLSLLLVTVLLLAGCGDPDQLEYDNDNRRYVREGDGAVFYRASANYLAVRIRKGDEVGSIGQVDADD
ncbi:MAG: hypothetical protein IJW16_04045, partial [Clostridia bacterium]|nr:hypothetical protein [Clostridia bacterium]